MSKAAKLVLEAFADYYSKTHTTKSSSKLMGTQIMWGVLRITKD